MTKFKLIGAAVVLSSTLAGPAIAAARNLQSNTPRPEHLLCGQGGGKSPQQVLRLPRMV
jgi:hypothetical protein